MTKDEKNQLLGLAKGWKMEAKKLTEFAIRNDPKSEILSFKCDRWIAGRMEECAGQLKNAVNKMKVEKE